MPSTSVSSTPSTSFVSKMIAFCFHLLLVLTPFTFTWFNDELFEFNKMMLTYGIASAIFGLWLIQMVIEKKVLFRRTWFDIPIALFVLSQIIATVFSMHPRTSWFGYYSRFHGGLLSTFTYVGLFYAFVSTISKRQIKLFVVSMLIAAAGVALYAIPEHFGYSFSCGFINGTISTECWSQDTNPKYRIFGTFGQPNWLAAYAITLLPLAVYWLLLQVTQHQNQASGTKKGSLVGAAAGGATIITLLFTTLLLTKSRSGFAGFGLGSAALGLGLLVTFIKQQKQHTSAKLQRSFQRSLTLVALALSGWLVLLVAWFGTPFSPSIKEVLVTLSATTSLEQSALPAPTGPVNRLEIGGTDSGEIRKIVWQGAIDVWKRYPLFGSGVETFAYSYYLDRPVEHNTVSEWAFLYNKAHNEFLNFLATTGIVGLVSYSILLAAFIGIPALYGLLLKPNELQPNVISTAHLGLAIASGLVGLSVSNFFGFSTVMVGILLFLLPAIFWVQANPDNQDPTSASTDLDFSFGQLLAISGCTIGVLWSIATVFGWWRADNLFFFGKQYAQAGKLSDSAALIAEAIEISPNEALYYEQLSLQYAQMAVVLQDQGQATQAATAATAAITTSQTALALNPVHLNLYKSQARMYMVLGNIDLKFYASALDSLEKARELGPTDAKVWYNIGLLQIALGNTNDGITTLEETIKLKPNYEEARMSLAGVLTTEGQWQRAADQYKAVLETIAPQNEVAAAELKQLEASISAQTQL